MVLSRQNSISSFTQSFKGILQNFNAQICRIFFKEIPMVHGSCRNATHLCRSQLTMSIELVMSCALNNKIWLFFSNFLCYYLDKILYQSLPKASKEFSKILMLRFVRFFCQRNTHGAWIMSKCNSSMSITIDYVDRIGHVVCSKQ